MALHSCSLLVALGTTLEGYKGKDTETRNNVNLYVVCTRKEAHKPESKTPSVGCCASHEPSFMALVHARA